MIDISLIPWAFVAGMLSILAPCTLPLIPAYLGSISGVSLEDLKDPAKAGAVRRKVLVNGLAFIIGFSAVFVTLGALVGFTGALLVAYRSWLARIGGIFVILFGLFMLNVLKIPFLERAVKFRPPTLFEQGRPLNSFILGAAFAFGWTPCVGPILGSILFLAGSAATALYGALLLAVFSAGLAVPFLAIALGIGSASRHLAKLSASLSVVSVVGGVFLVVLGILLVTDNMALLILYGFQLFRFINYDRILDYL
ncbi:sulfite exporter TauE/SafE family protein [Candidatus Kaiserbacteria bacterium]|nr:sulfite exporter TauE/SafE family protein [Candidatus Kaiserbacteria bacterium]